MEIRVPYISPVTHYDLVQEWQRANAVLEALLVLPPAHNLALMARVQDGNMRFLEGVFAELVSMLWHGEDANVQKYGLPAVEYLVRRWLVGFGSYREFAEEFGMCASTASSFCKARVSGQLDAWLVAACGSLESVCEKFAIDDQAAA